MLQTLTNEPAYDVAYVPQSPDQEATTIAYIPTMHSEKLGMEELAEVREQVTNHFYEEVSKRHEGKPYHNKIHALDVLYYCEDTFDSVVNNGEALRELIGSILGQDWEQRYDIGYATEISRIYVIALALGHDVVQDTYVDETSGLLKRKSGMDRETENEGRSAAEIYDYLSGIEINGVRPFEFLTEDLVRAHLEGTVSALDFSKDIDGNLHIISFKQPLASAHEDYVGMLLRYADLAGYFHQYSGEDFSRKSLADRCEERGNAEFREIHPNFVRLIEQGVENMSAEDQYRVMKACYTWLKLQPEFFSKLGIYFLEGLRTHKGDPFVDTLATTVPKENMEFAVLKAEERLNFWTAGSKLYNYLRFRQLHELSTLRRLTPQEDAEYSNITEFVESNSFGVEEMNKELRSLLRNFGYEVR